MKPSNGQGPTDNDDFSDAAMIESSLQDAPQSWQGGSSQTSWQDGGAPIDDFSDPSAEGVAHVTEASERADEDSSVSDAESTGKKSPKWLPIAAGVGGAIFIGAMLYWQFGSASSTSPVAMLQQKPATHATSAPKNTVANDAVAPTSSLTPIVTANAVAPSSESAPSLPAPSVEQKGVALPGSGTTQLTTPPMTTSPLPVSNAAIADTKPSLPPALPLAAAGNKNSPSPSSGGEPELAFPAMTAASAPEPQVKQPETTGSPKASVAETSMPLAFDIQKSASTGESSSQGDTARVAALNSQIETLQKELETTQQQLARATMRVQELQSQAEKPRHQQPTLSLGRENYASVEEKSSLLSSSKHKKSASNRRGTNAQKSSVSKRNAEGGAWVLRAASPDEAWVAKGQDSPAIQPVRVGDTLQGVGRITSIRQDGDQWIVEGTQGYVR